MSEIPASARYERQILLLGERGQAALAAATAYVDGPEAADVIAVRYARRAGFASIQPAPETATGRAPDEASAEIALQSEEARVILNGARAALREILRVVAPEDGT